MEEIDFMKIRQDIASYLQDFDERYADPKTYAAAMTEYLRNKCKVVNEQLATCLELANAVDSEGLPYSPEAVLDCVSDQTKLFEPGTYVEVSGGTTFIPKKVTIPEGSVFEWSGKAVPSEISDKINLYAGTAISSGDTIVDFCETYRQMCYYVNGLIDGGSSRIVSAQSGLLKSVNDIQEAAGIFSTETSAILTTLSAIKDGVVESASDLLNQGKALLGEITNTAIFQNITGIMTMTNGSPMDMVKGIGGMIANSAKQLMDTSEDNTKGTFVCQTNIGDYQDVSAVSAFAASEVTVFKTAAKAVKTVVGVAAGVVGGLMKIGAKLVKKAVKMVAPYVTNPIFTVNEHADRDTLDIPIITFRSKMETFANSQALIECTKPYYNADGHLGPEYHARLYNYFSTVLGNEDVTAPDYWTTMILCNWLKDTEALCLDMKFGQAYCYKYTQNNEDYIALELYAIPTKPLTDNYAKLFNFGEIVPQDTYNPVKINLEYDDPEDLTIREKLNLLFPQDPTFIQVTSEDLYKDDNVVNFTNCIRASVYRMLVYWYLRANVYNISLDEDDEERDNILDNYGYLCGFVDGYTNIWSGIHQWGGFMVLPNYGETHQSTGTPLTPLTPTWDFDTHEPANAQGAQWYQYWTTNWNQGYSDYDMYQKIKSICLGEQINLSQGESVTPDWFIKKACINADPNNTLISACTPFIHMFFAGVLAQILSNKYEFMKDFYDRYEDFPVFIPYKTVVNLDSSRYHLQTTAQMMEKAEKLKNLAATIATLLITVAAVVAIKVLVKKGLTKVMEKVSAKAEGDHYSYQGMQQAYTNNTTYSYIPAGRYTTVTKDQLHFIEKYSAMYASIWRQLYNEQIEYVTCTDNPDVGQVEPVEFVPDKNDYTYFTKHYCKSAKLSKLKSKLLSKCGVQPISYNIYASDDNSETEQSTVDQNMNDLINMTAYDEDFVQVRKKIGQD